MISVSEYKILFTVTLVTFCKHMTVSISTKWLCSPIFFLCKQDSMITMNHVDVESL